MASDNEKSKRIYETPGVGIYAAASAVGKMEFEGPLGDLFDLHDGTDRYGQETFEKSESEMQRVAFAAAMGKVKLRAADVDMLFAGDLLNQCVGSAYGLLEYDIPYLGLYGACSTAAEGLVLSSLVLSGGACSVAGAVTSSHNATAERQYRTPLEYGGQRTPTAQWTVTGAGAFISAREGALDGTPLALVREVMPGIVIERGVCDANNMGAAMAPSAADTLIRYFGATGKSPGDFDRVITGDLGLEGSLILHDLLTVEGFSCDGMLDDCGMMIYDRQTQDVHSGGSGCGCSAVVLASHLLPRLASGELQDILFLGTGAMMSPSSTKQGEAIPAVAHLLRLTSPVWHERRTRNRD